MNAFTIVLVEPEEKLREEVREILRQDGYRVWAFGRADYAAQAGARAKSEQEYSRVVDLYRRGITAYPNDPRLLNGLAWFYVKHRINLDEAFRLARRAHDLEPKSWQIVDTLAEIHYARGNVVQAHQLALQALNLDPKNPYLRDQVNRFQDLVEREGH